MNIAIFGGSFNPVHNEHVNLVRAAIGALKLDKVLIVPTNSTPQKDGSLTATPLQRLETCRLAFEDVERAEVSDIEIKRGGVSYSYKTCEELAQKYRGEKLYFIVGADMLENFAKWKYPERILNCVTLAVCARKNKSSLKEPLKNFKSRFDKEAVAFDYVGADVSSTEIRTLAALGENLSGVCEKVADYIEKNKIYGIERIAEVKNLLTEKRWRHTVGVAQTAAKNCRRAGVCEKKAITAAALHDCAKYLGAESPYLDGFSCHENVPEQVAHQYSGAYVAEREFKITDTEILNAIKYHTSGRAGMTPLEKLIFLSDMLEPSRNFDGVETLRALFLKDIDECLFAALKHQIDYLNLRGEKIYPKTLEAYEFLKENKNDE